MAKDAELKHLLRAPGRGVVVPLALQQVESGPKRLPEARRVVTHDRQAAAFLRPIQREGRDDGVTADLQALFEPRDVGRTVAVLSKKVERGPVVPNVIRPRRLPRRGVGDKPMRPGPRRRRTK